MFVRLCFSFSLRLVSDSPKFQTLHPTRNKEEDPERGKFLPPVVLIGSDSVGETPSGIAFLRTRPSQILKNFRSADTPYGHLNLVLYALLFHHFSLLDMLLARIFIPKLSWVWNQDLIISGFGFTGSYMIAYCWFCGGVFSVFIKVMLSWFLTSDWWRNHLLYPFIQAKNEKDLGESRKK